MTFLFLLPLALIDNRFLGELDTMSLRPLRFVLLTDLSDEIIFLSIFLLLLILTWGYFFH